jgi:hypothetical protein
MVMVKGTEENGVVDALQSKPAGGEIAESDSRDHQDRK